MNSFMVAVAQLVEYQIVALVAAGSRPVSHPIHYAGQNRVTNSFQVLSCRLNPIMEYSIVQAGSRPQRLISISKGSFIVLSGAIVTLSISILHIICMLFPSSKSIMFIISFSLSLNAFASILFS